MQHGQINICLDNQRYPHVFGSNLRAVPVVEQADVVVLLAVAAVISGWRVAVVMCDS